MSLGDKLKAANEARALEVSKDEIKKREEQREAFDYDEQIILLFLEKMKNDFTVQIEMGISIQPVRLPFDPPWNTYSWTGRDMAGSFQMTNHPHYSAIQTFFIWARDNGLRGKFIYEHDGVGMESWYVATVEPL